MHDNVDKAYYMPGGAPFFFRGDDVGCLCVHGLNANPQEMLWLGKHLAGHGYTVYGPRLTGHGTSIEDMRHTTWHDWYGVVLDGYRLLRQQCRRVFVLGLSLGGLLSLHLGTREQPDGLAVLAGPLFLNQPLLPYARYLKYFQPYTRKNLDENHYRIDERMRTIQARQGEPVIGRSAYGHFPMASLAEMYDLQQVTGAQLSALTAPLMLVYSEGDRTVPVENLAQIVGAVGTPAADLHQLKLEESDHLLTLDIEKDTVFETVASFIDHYAAG
ncbi:MAG: alpha/beta fold hydrolase [Anaerolineae bacterium]|nr:alpha/beta fold hydrolase [Anaerolineae bacterium]